LAWVIAICNLFPTKPTIFFHQKAIKYTNKKSSTPKSVVDVRHCGLDPQSLSTAHMSIYNHKHNTEILGQAQDDERVSTTHSGDEP